MQLCSSESQESPKSSSLSSNGCILRVAVTTSTTHVIVYGEFGKMPLSVIRKIRIVRYWFRITKDPSTLIFKLYNMRDVHYNMINTLSIKSLFDELGFSYLFEALNLL